MVPWRSVSVFPYPPYLFLILTDMRPTDWDMIFADDEQERNPTSFKFLQLAHAWKEAAKAGGAVPSFPVAAPVVEVEGDEEVVEAEGAEASEAEAEAEPIDEE